MLAHRQPLSRYAQKIYDTICEAGGFLKCWNMTFSRAIGLTSTGHNDFLGYLDECVDKDYVRVMFTDGLKEKNGFFTFERFYQDVVPRLRERNYEAYLLHTEYIECKMAEVQSEKESR